MIFFRCTSDILVILITLIMWLYYKYASKLSHLLCHCFWSYHSCWVLSSVFLWECFRSRVRVLIILKFRRTQLPFSTVAALMMLGDWWWSTVHLPPSLPHSTSLPFSPLTLLGLPSHYSLLLYSFHDHALLYWKVAMFSWWEINWGKRDRRIRYAFDCRSLKEKALRGRVFPCLHVVRLRYTAYICLEIMHTEVS